MGQVAGAALDGAAGRLHVDPEEVTHEGFLQVGVYVRVVHDPHEFVHRDDGLTHGLDEPVLALNATHTYYLYRYSV